MIILSVQLGHNATVGLLIDGKIVGLISEEKFDNIKNSSAFHEQLIRWLLNELNVKNIDYILVGNLGQALCTFENSGLKYLAIQNYLVSKNV